MIVCKAAPGLFESVNLSVVEVHARPYAVEKDEHFDSRPRALAEGFLELGGHFSRIKQKRLEIDAPLRAPDGGQHGGENLVAIMQELDFVALERHRIRQGMRVGEKCRVADRLGMRHPIVDHIPPHQKEIAPNKKTATAIRTRNRPANSQGDF